LIVVLGGYFIAQKISGNKSKSMDQVVQVKKTVKDVDINNNNNETTVEKEVELSIRPDDFYKKKKN